MKKTISIFLIALLAMGILACSKPAASEQKDDAPTATSEQPETTVTEAPAETVEPTAAPEEPVTEQLAEPTEAPTAEPTEEPAPHKTVLVVVFSATGTTMGVAEKIAASRRHVKATM